MCLTDEDKAKIKDDSISREMQWQLIYEAIDNCEWEAEDPWNDGDWIVTVSCKKCCATFSGVAGGSEVAFDAYLSD